MRLTKETQSPWFLKVGLVKVPQPPFLHCSMLVGPAAFTGKARNAGASPTGMVATTVLVAVSITETLLLLEFAT